MRWCALASGVALAVLSASTASAVYRITGDTGGQIGPHLETLVAVRNSGQMVIIDGPCFSACTLVLGVIPRERLCVTSRARLGFHAAWLPGPDGQPVFNKGGTDLLMSVYPQNVKNWIASRGGLTRNMKYLSGRLLASMFPTCP